MSTSLLTTADAARIAHTTRITVYRWCRDGVLIDGERRRLPHAKVGRYALIDRDDLVAFIRDHRPEMLNGHAAKPRRQRRRLRLRA